MKTCEICQKADSEIEISVFLDENLIRLSVCPSCAEDCKLNFESLEQGTVPDFIEHFMAIDKSRAEDTDCLDLTCPECSTTGEEFVETGHLGCPFCYSVFRDLLSEHLPTASMAHCGKSAQPHHSDSILSLQKRLKAAVKREAYEEAAQLRDRILELQESEEAVR